MKNLAIKWSRLAIRGTNCGLKYLSKYGVINFGGTLLPNKAVSRANFNKTCLTTSPKYIPEISFSKIWDEVRKKKPEESVANSRWLISNYELQGLIHNSDFRSYIPRDQDLSFQHLHSHQMMLKEDEENWTFPTPC